MIVKKKKAGGYINPAYEKFERAMANITFFLIVCIFLALVAWVVIEFGKTNAA
ncbi:MAG: hypothetical protein H6Q12_383 [Bacteroidetes bacterium]|nr:hypothetical protein [Bacteroidota bacterium]